jgi:hypothetical protein
MSLHANRATMSLLNMTREMFRKNIEIGRITKTCALLLMSGLSRHDINPLILERCLHTQHADGGFVGNTDTLWNIKLLEYFPEFRTERAAAIQWLTADNGVEAGFGRSKRDMHRIPVTGLVLYILPELADGRTLDWLEATWLSELNSLTYKAAFTLLAFSCAAHSPRQLFLLEDTTNWLLSQQQDSGGFAPWINHPVGENVYCTAVAMLGLMSIKNKACQAAVAHRYKYLCETQLKSGIWPFHEIEEGAAWGLLALAQSEQFLDDCQ